jgi:hypothetical protein
MNERYVFNSQGTPAEMMEAADKVKEREAGKEEAKYYAAYLGDLKTNVKKAIDDVLKRNTDRGTEMSIREIFDNAIYNSNSGERKTRSIKDYSEGAITEAQKLFPEFQANADFKVNFEELENMTPDQFFARIDELENSLIK